jgi:hypothetical protein
MADRGNHGGQDPEELIEDGQFGSPVSTLEDTELLTKCESRTMIPNQSPTKRNMGQK